MSLLFIITVCDICSSVNTYFSLGFYLLYFREYKNHISIDQDVTAIYMRPPFFSLKQVMVWVVCGLTSWCSCSAPWVSRPGCRCQITSLVCCNDTWWATILIITLCSVKLPRIIFWMSKRDVAIAFPLFTLHWHYVSCSGEDTFLHQWRCLLSSSGTTYNIWQSN